MHSLFKGVILIFGLALTTCSPVPQCPAASEEHTKKAEAALTDFAVNLFKNVSSRDENKNEVMSPISIALAMALLENGADGKTREELRNALVGIDSQVDVLGSYRAIQKQLRVDDEKTKLIIANGMFQDKTLELEDNYLTKTRDCLETKIDNDNDFANKLEEVRQKINKWVSEKTSKKIPELFKKDVLTKDDLMVLANAIYFKASWKDAFNKAMTKEEVFYKNGRDQDKQTVQFMHGVADHQHASTDAVDVLEMAYEKHDMAMYVILPKTRDGLREFEKRLTGKELRTIMSNMRQRRVDVKLPKFTVSSPIDLKDVLKKMGLESMFSNMADFRRMSERELKVDSAIHEAFIDVHENGTEAAAATGVSITSRSMPIHPVDPVSFVADHPFMYAIVHKTTGAIVFLGKVNSIESRDN